MAHLPEDRIGPEPPRTTVGDDTFGPWNESERREETMLLKKGQLL